jgi:hypothetical protein
MSVRRCALGLVAGGVIGGTPVRKAGVPGENAGTTNNGDGTLTITILATGNAVLYDENGTPIARHPGQIRFQILIDTNGTLEDPFDDEEIAFLGVVKGSTGRSDDFCEAAVPALT